LFLRRAPTRAFGEMKRSSVAPARSRWRLPPELQPSARASPAGRTMRLLRAGWNDRRIGLGVVAATAALYGLFAGWWTPRGPITTSEALTTIVLSLLVGALAGLVSRSRWAMLLAPVMFVAMFELVRVIVVGPTVDAIHPGSFYGLVALAVGRGFHGLVALLPMAYGAALGAAIARRMSGATVARVRRRFGTYARRSASVLVAVGLVALVAAIARPARTDPILGPDGKPLPGSVAELTRVEIGGHDLSMMIRSHSVENPVLLYLAGGPGGTELGAMRRHLQSLEQDFVVVTFDQRGAGKSYDQLEPVSTMTLDNAIRDVLEVTRYLRDRFDEERIYLVGQSWGSTLGVLALQQEPDLYRAFVGVGQMVSQRETDLIFYEDTLAWARKTGDTGLADTLDGNGPPPYASILDYEPALSHEMDLYPYDHIRNSEGEGQMSENLFVEEYSLIDQVHALGAFMDVFTILYPQLQEIDFRVDVPRLDVPVYLVEGGHEAPGRADLAREWFAKLKAPSKQMVVFDTSGHRPLFEQPDLFQEVMTKTVLAETLPDAGSRVGT
jgi:pimeloyl-ACP methyl ester carboxylesterase